MAAGTFFAISLRKLMTSNIGSAKHARSATTGAGSAFDEGPGGCGRARTGIVHTLVYTAQSSQTHVRSRTTVHIVGIGRRRRRGFAATSQSPCRARVRRCGETWTRPTRSSRQGGRRFQRLEVSLSLHRGKVDLRDAPHLHEVECQLTAERDPPGAFLDVGGAEVRAFTVERKSQFGSAACVREADMDIPAVE